MLRGGIGTTFACTGGHIRVSATPLGRTAISQRRMPVLPRAQQVVVRGPSNIAGYKFHRPNPTPLGPAGEAFSKARFQSRMGLAICGFHRASRLFPGSSAVEQPAVNRLVAGSNPARGATYCLFIQRRPCPYLGSVLSL